MKLEKWAHLAEIIGGVTIVVSLFVLIFEVRTNSRLLERQIELDRIARTSAPMDSPYLPVILEKMLANREDQSATRRGFAEEYGLSTEEADRYVRYLRGQWQAFQADFRAGVGEQLDIAVRYRLTLPDHELFWTLESDQFESEFIRYVAEL